MPNAKVLAQKQEIVKGLAETMKNASSGVLVDYKGISVEQDTKLRATLRQNNVEYSVIKNTLARFAIKEIGFDQLDDILNGTTAMAVSMDDSILPAKLICEFAKKNPKIFKVKAGFIDGKVVDSAMIERVGDLPSKEILYATLLGTINAPIAALARTLDAIAKKMEAAGGTLPEAPAEAEAPAAEAAPAEEAAAAPVEEAAAAPAEEAPAPEAEAAPVEETPSEEA